MAGDTRPVLDGTSTASAVALASFCRVGAVGTILMGGLVLVGWSLDMAMLTSLSPGLAPMQPSAAVLSVIAGLALWRHRPRRRIGSGGLLASIGAAVMVLASGAMLLEYATGWKLGIDHILFRDRTTALMETSRMAPVVALAFALFGLALLFLDVETRRGFRPAQWLILTGLVILGVTGLGLLYGATQLYSFGVSRPSVHTVLTLLVLGSAILCARPGAGVMRLFTSEDPGTTWTRRMLPVLIVVPVTLGWLQLEGERAGMFDESLGTSIYVAVNLVCVVALMWWRTASIERVERDLRQAWAEATDNQDRLVTTLDSLAEGVITIDRTGRVQRMNPAGEALTGWLHADADGKVLADLVAETVSPPEAFPLAEVMRAEAVERREICIRGDRSANGRVLGVSARPLGQTTTKPAGAVIVLRDITEERAARARQGTAERGTVGMLAAGVAHEINNPLASVIANLDLALLQIDAQPARAPDRGAGELREKLVDARAGAERVRKIVRELKVVARVENEAGRALGSEPSLDAYLPRPEASGMHPALDAGSSGVTLARAPVRRGRVMIVDDDPLVGTALRRVLSSEHDVVSLTSAIEARRLIEQGQRFDVILCDLMMPDVTGMDFYQELYVLDPDQAGKVMFMTGGAYSDRAREFLARVPNMRIDKPFDIGQLRAMVRARVKQQQQQRGKSGAA